MGGSGTFQGHAIPASFFFGFGCFFLGLTFKRCRGLVLQESSATSSGDGGGKSFCDKHIPERNTVLLSWTSIILLIITSIGMIYEAGGGYRDGIGLFHQLAHLTLYLCFFFVGAVTWLESRGSVPPDSSRVALSFAFFLQYILWNEHGLMKDDMSDARVHLLQAQVNLVASFSFGYSVYNPKSLLAYVSGWALMTLNALWMFTAGLSICCVDLILHTVGAALALEALLIATVLVVGAVLCSGPLLAQHQINGGNSNSRNNDAVLYRSVASSPSYSVDEEESAVK